VWHRGTYTILPTLGGASATATAVNSRGVVVGTSDRVPEGRSAVVWHNDTAIDLGTLGGLNSAPADIDEQGRIVGIAERSDGRTHAVLWTPRH
jgi:probable HAF family extracellular repeat protein